MNKKIEAKIENLYPLLDSIDQTIRSYSVDEELLATLHICIEEVFVNVVSYAYGEQVGLVEVETEVNDGWLSITFRDEGIPYNPLEREDPDLDLALEERPIGGLGIYMIRNMMDSVQYEYKEGRNNLCIRKEIY
ncbi:MAG: ATP-binding protein [Lachnospiraceae bacterium]|nr:ATP-binding protein [Lachnospiraceae bacterium]